MALIDDVIDENLQRLREEKYKLRTFQVMMDLNIDSEYGVEETLQAIRAIQGVTVVTAIDSVYSKQKSGFVSTVKVKFHPARETMTPIKYINKELLPSIRDRSIPGVSLLRVGSPTRIS